MRGDSHACTEQVATGDAKRVAKASAKAAVAALTGAPAKKLSAASAVEAALEAALTAKWVVSVLDFLEYYSLVPTPNDEFDRRLVEIASRCRSASTLNDEFDCRLVGITGRCRSAPTPKDEFDRRLDGIAREPSSTRNRRNDGVDEYADPVTRAEK